MKKKISILMVALLIMGSLLGFAGCNRDDNENAADEILYNADRIWLPLEEEFIAQNRINAFYSNKEWQEGDDPRYELIEFPDAPDNRTFVFREKEDAANVFAVDLAMTPKIDFDTQMVVLYLYGSVNERKSSVKKVKVENEILNIVFETVNYDQNWVPNYPMFTSFTILLDKVDFKEVQIIRQRKRV